MLTITTAGLAAATDAATQGFKISLRTFKVSEYNLADAVGVNLSEVTDLVGTSVFTGEISVAEVVGTSAVKLTLLIPKELPRSGSWMLRELGIYLESGELFAIGALEPAYEKNSEYSIKIYTVCSANRLGEVVNVNLNQNNSLPIVANVFDLPTPLASEHSVVAVLDQTLCDYTDNTTAGLAIKSGPGLLHWAFTGYHRVYYGHVDTIVAQQTFKITEAAGGFWLNDDEIVIGQITSGAGYGQTRRIKYTKANATFTVLDTVFSGMNETSILAVWRDNANQIPKRDHTIPYHMVLGHGLNTWERVIDPPANLYTFDAVVISNVLNAESQFGDTAIRPADADRFVMVYADGKLLPESQYSLSPNVVTVFGRNYGTKVDILMFIRSASTEGGTMNAFESKHSGDGQTKRFYTSVVPKTYHWLSVFTDGLYRHKSEYSFDGTSVLFYEAPVDNAEVAIIQYSMYKDNYGSSEWSRTFRQMAPGELDIAINPLPSLESQTLVFVDGDRYTLADYQFTSTGIQLIKLPTYPGGLSYVEVVTMLPVITNADPYATASVSGLDTGPIWTDPAGLEGPPNRLVPKITSILSDGAARQYTVPYAATRDQVLVFANGRFLQQDSYSYATGISTATVELNTAAPAGAYVDVIVFEDIDSEEGFGVECTAFNATSTTDTVYQLATVTDTDSIIVTVGGYYRHKSTYSIDTDSKIYFQGIESGKSIEVWYYKTVPHSGWRTTIRQTKSGAASANIYPIAQTVQLKQDVLTFVGELKYDSVQYDLNISRDKLALNPNAATNTPIVAVSFASGPPKSRLLTRAEYNQSVVSFNYRNGAVLLTREDIQAVLSREDILALLTASERAVLAGGGGGTNPDNHAEPGNAFTSTNWIVPANVYHIRAVIIAGGGQGGGASATMTYAGHGGKRGEVLIQELDVVPGQALEVRLGVGGSSYLYTANGTTVYPQPGDFGTTDGMYGYRGRNGENTIFHQWVALGGAGGLSDPAYAPSYAHVDSNGESQLPTSGTGTLVGGGLPGVTGVQTPNNNVLVYSYPGTNGAFGYSESNSTGGGGAATSPGAGGGGAAGDPLGIGAFGGPGANGIVYISWG